MNEPLNVDFFFLFLQKEKEEEIKSTFDRVFFFFLVQIL
jgi:hypothetical protein